MHNQVVKFLFFMSIINFPNKLLSPDEKLTTSAQINLISWLIIIVEMLIGIGINLSLKFVLDKCIVCFIS